MHEVVIIATTLDSRSKAQVMARALVEARLAACAQILPIESVYRWNGEVEQVEEFLLQIKTTAAYAEAAEALIATLHDYELPEITVTAVAGGSAAYLGWVEQSVGELSADRSG